MAEYPPNAAVSLPDDITTTTPGQFADWHAAEAAYRTGVGAYHLINAGDPRAAAEAFSASSAVYAVSALTRALMEHAPDAVAGVVADINATYTAGRVSDRAGEWLHEIGVDGLMLHEAGHEDTAKARARYADDDLARRVADLEQQHADLARLVHGHGEDIGQAQAAIRGLGTYYTAEGDG